MAVCPCSRELRWLTFLIAVTQILRIQAAAFLSASRQSSHSLHLDDDSSPTKASSRLHASSLVPEHNPIADQLQDTKSLSGVRFGSVLAGINKLFPPTQLEQRNALSRTDGYWPYVQDGKEAPKQHTYGEYDFYFFGQLLDRAHEIFFDGIDSPPSDWTDKIFTDVGSGMGRLVFSAAALHPGWQKCRGVELLPSIHKAAQEQLECCRVDKDDHAHYALPPVTDQETDESTLLPLAPIEFTCGSFEDPSVYFGDSDLIFVFSSCMSPELLEGLSESIGRQCKPGTLVITTDYMLPLEGEIEPIDERDPNAAPHGPFKLKLMEKVDGWCWLTGGASTAFVHRVEQSLWTESGPGRPLEISLEEKCFKMLQALEEDREERYQKFLVGVYNNLMWSPDDGLW